MHHPEILIIVQALDDFFIIAQPRSTTSIRGDRGHWGNENSIIICRELVNGKLEIHIKGEDEDDNDLTFLYYQSASKEQFDKKLDISSSDFCLATVTKAIRDVVIYDSNIEPLTNKDVDLWLSR